MDKLADRFIKYAKYHTSSDEKSSTFPSTGGQLIFAKYLVDELTNLGLSDVKLDDNGYVTATLPSNVDKDVPTLGFIAHMDTSPEVSGENVSPRIIEKYDGEEIVLDEDGCTVLSPDDFPELKNYIGCTIITTDGTTLLGADDKAGIAEIITALEYLKTHPEIPHGVIKVAFTPDEEIGKGADFFDVKAFDAGFAYTVDGGPLGELEYENFNAASAEVIVRGKNVHPGTAKGKMVNSIELAMELHNMLPKVERPEYTEGYEGFYHLNDFHGSVEETVLKYIIRDHDFDNFNQKKQLLTRICEFLNEKYAEGTVKLSIKDQYYNMKEKIAPAMHVVQLAKEAMELVKVKPVIKPIRGGTDGARLSYMGLPCPNIFTGGHNFHGKYEFIPLESMKKAVEVIVKIAELNAVKNA